MSTNAKTAVFYVLLCALISSAPAFADPFAFDDDADDPVSFRATINRIRDAEIKYKREVKRREEDERRREEEEREREAAAADKGRTDAPGDKPDFSDHDDDLTEKKRLGDIDTSSQFNKSDFSDTDFSKRAFSSLDKAMRKPDDDFLRDMDKIKNDDGDNDDSIPEDAGLNDYTARKDAKNAKERRELAELMYMEYPLPGDWLPSKLDPLNNGGFTISDDNGSPVPYKLNGHVDLQRAPAWKSAE